MLVSMCHETWAVKPWGKARLQPFRISVYLAAASPRLPCITYTDGFQWHSIFYYRLQAGIFRGHIWRQ